ncbi:uncharacterized protein F4822DRAFT_443332 [Hypoxylon trugodes]|uniref:uncharacterized protein n=1 Tax=Hypoxylon trugodes TaxID=326681 RepID=UPI00219D5B1A|nr:uncharacterized protein F4822DRAFT_443332 [Hypoxylon trugodes]KAI1388174.1 hypothetical protein F4822DRAFT_443332 [Hypoxylon trugodes]
MFAISDFLEEDKERRFLEKGMTESFERHYFLKKNPIWSGLMDFRCRLVLNNLAFRFISETPVVLGAAFVYVASRLGYITGLHWPQMERFLKIHGEDKVLQGTVSPELTPIVLLKRFVDSNLFGADSSSINKFIGPPKPVKALHQRYAWELLGHYRQPTAYLKDIVQDKVDAELDEWFLKQASTNPATLKDTIGSAIVSPVQLLEILDETTTSILENDLSIDYFLLHKESVKLLRDLIGGFSSEVEKDIPSLMDVDVKTDKLALLLQVVYKSMTEGNVVETTERMRKVMTRVCSELR